jgi:hypothetical protein
LLQRHLREEDEFDELILVHVRIVLRERRLGWQHDCGRLRLKVQREAIYADLLWGHQRVHLWCGRDAVHHGVELLLYHPGPGPEGGQLSTFPRRRNGREEPDFGPRDEELGLLVVRSPLSSYCESHSFPGVGLSGVDATPELIGIPLVV